MYDDYNGTNNSPLQVEMAPKMDIVYSRGCSKSVATSRQMIDSLEDERDLESVPLGFQTATTAARATQGTPTKVESGVIMASQWDKEHTLTGTPPGSTTSY